MFWILFCLCLPLLSRSDDSDPDIDICTDTKLDAGVLSDDGFSYIFKGNHFWQVKDFATNAIPSISYAELIKNKWPDVSGPIKAAFVVKEPQKSNLLTVLVVKDRFYAYGKGLKVMDGSTESWRPFNELKEVTASFEMKRNSSLVFVLHDNNKMYSLFNFSNSLIKPQMVGTNKTQVRKDTIFFLDDSYSGVSKTNFATSGPIDSLLDVNSVITLKDKLVIMASKKWCIVDLNRPKFEKSCTVNETTAKLIGCPINIANRPTTTLSSTTEEHSGTQDGLKGTEKNGNTSAPNSLNNTAIDRNLSTIYAIAFNSGLICVTIVLMIVIVIISKLANNRPKGTVYYIK